MRKTSTRVLSAIMAVMMLVGLVPMMSISSSAAFNDTSLKFDENGDFTVIQIADIQDDTEVHETTLALISKAMNKYNPDLVVFTGDNVQSGMDEGEFKSSVSQFMAPIIAAGVRYAVTFGNHDAEDKSIVNTAWDKQSQYNHFIGMSSLSVDFDENSLSGVGTGSIPIYSNDGSRVAFCVFPIDSGMYDSNNDYDYVKDDQIAWYASEADRLATLNNGNKVPTLVFQHIPVPEIYSNLLVECASTDPGAVTGQTPNYSGKYWRLDPNNPTITGVMGEGPCPPTVNNGQYQGWLDVGNMVGAFFGHDHKNDFVGTDANGITMGYCKAATLAAYHSDDNDPAVRVFNIKEDGTYTTQSVTYSAMQQEETEDYERDEISGTPTVPEVLYVGAADNSIAKQEYGTTIQLQSLNHKTQSMYNNDLTVTIDLNKAAADVTLSAQGISFSPVSVTENEASNTYTWTITGGSANAGNVVEYKVNYNFEDTAYVQYAYSYVDNIKSPAGHYVYVRNYGGVLASNDAYWNTQTYVMTVLGKNVYGHARSTTDDSYADLEAWTNAPAGYYNYTGTADAGFVQKDTSYGMNFCSPSRIKTHAEFPRFQQAGKSPVATIYADTSVSNSLTDLGISVNYWRHYTPEHNVQPTIQFAFKPGDASYAYNTWNTDTVGSSTISVQNASVVLPAARLSNVNNPIVGGAIPADGTTYTLISYASSHYDGGLYATNVYTFMPVLLQFVTYNKAELRTLLNAERTANRQVEGEDLKNTTYRQAFKEAYKQIQKPDTTQADINAAKSRLEKAIENLTFTGEDISSGNGEYYANPTVPSKIYVAGSGYGLSAQPKGTTVVPQIINYRTRAMIDYSNFKIDLPNGATNALVEVYNKNTGAAITHTWDPATASGKVTGGTANVGDTIVYKFTYERDGKSYTQYEASTVTDAPQASGWLTFIRRWNGWGTNQTSQESIIFFAPEGAPADGIQYEALQGNAGYDNAYYGVNLTNFSGDRSQKVSGFGINSWTGPSRQTNGGWYCGDKGKDDTKDGGYRAKFNLYFDTSLPVNLTQAKMLFTAIGLRTQGDAATIHQNGETYYSGQGNHPNYGDNVGTINSAAYDDAGNALSEATFNDAQGDLMYRYMLFDTVPAGAYTYYTYMWAQNGSKNAITCHYAWHINITGVDKTDLRNLVAQENQIFRQVTDGYSDANGKWTAYLDALADAKGAVQDASLTAAQNAAIEAKLQTAISELEYVRADYTALEAKIAQICEIHYDENGNRYYHYRPNEIVNPLYYNREEYYPAEYFNVSVNEMNVPLDEILDNKMNLDIRYQDEVKDFVDILDIGWQSAQLRNADYSVVDSYLELKTGTNPNGSTGGLTIILPELEKYEFVGADDRDVSWENFTTDSYNAWANACAPAMSNRSLKSPDQPIVDGYATALETAYNALELKPADYTALDKTIADATANIDSTVTVVDPSDATRNYDITYYEADYIKDIRDTCAEKVEGLYILQQGEVDVLQHRIDQLYVALGNHLNEADFTFANEQKGIKAQYEDEYAKYYTPESWNRLVEARAEVDEGLNYGYMVGEQDVVNDLAQEVYDARNALTYNSADYSEVNAWLAKITELEPTKNDYVNWADVDAAVAAVDSNLDITKQTEVDAMAENLAEAYNALKLKDADYSKLNNQIIAAQAIMNNQALYTPGSYTNFLAGYNQALTFYMAEPKVDIQHQATVDAEEANLIAAMEQLDYIDANIAPLEDAVGYYMSVDYYAYEAEYPTDTDGDGVVDVYEAVDAEYQKAQALLDKYNNDELDIRNDGEILAAADALTAAVNNLPALYEGLNWEIENIPEDYYTTPEKYTAESRQKLADALAAIDRNLKIVDQDKVYEYTDAVIQAVAGLEEADANLTELKAAITAADQKIAGVDTSTYTDGTWAAFDAAYKAATAIRDADPAPKYSDQADVDAATQALVTATANLQKKAADYTELNAAIAEANDLNKNDWTPETWADVENALAAANNISKDLTVDDQATIDAAAQALKNAVAKLEEADIPCDYAALDAALAAAAQADTTNCTSASVTEFNAALAAANAVARDLIVDDAGVNQKSIDDAAARLNAAITGLTKLSNCNYDALDAALTDAAEADTTDCTSASVAEFNAALAAAQAVERGMISDEAGVNQAKIDAAATRLDAAVKGLTKLGKCDYAALDAALTDAAEADTTDCTSASVAEFNAALAAAQAVERDMIADEAGANQAEIDAAATRLDAAVKGLTKLGKCEYDALDAAIAAYDAKVADKDLYANWAEYEAAYNAAKAIARDLVADEAGANQKAIDDATAALNAVVLAYKAADYSAVEAAKAKIPADMSTALYTAASVKAVEDAVAAVVEGYNITKQAEVDAMAAAIEDAVEKLVKLGNCNYDALDAAIAKVPAKEADAYSTVTWNAYTKALADAEAVERGMIADEAGVNQATVDAATKALVDAYNALADKEFCDYRELETLVLYCSELDADEAYYDATDLAEWQAALAAAQALLAAEKLEKTDENQAIIDNAAAALDNEYSDLYEIYADLSELEAAVDAYGEHKIENEIERYTEDSWAAYEAALAAAQEALVTYDIAPDTAEVREIIAGLAKDLEDAYNNLEIIVGFCDYSELEEAVLYCSELDADEACYDATDLAEWKAALAEAITLLESEPLYLTDANQAIIDNAAAALINEYSDLYEIYADLSELEAAVEDCDENTIENEIERYTADSWAAYESALTAAKEALVTYDIAPDSAEVREIIAGLAKDLRDAYAALELITGYCDYSDLEEAVLYCSELDADEAYYDAAELAEWKAALAEAITLLESEPLYLTPENQAIIDNAAAALIKEYTDLYEIYADLSELEAAVDAYGEDKIENEIERYTPDSWAAYEAALAAAKEALVTYDIAPDSAEVREIIAGLAKDLEDAYNGLTILGNCDYTELNAAIAEYEAKLADKDLYANWAEYEAAYDAAQAIDEDMIADAAGENQAKIDAAADALNAVVLVYKDADYSAVEAAKAKIPADLSSYTEDSVKAVEDAVAAVVEGYDITKQAEVDAFAAAIEEAVEKLAKKGADYSALEAAIARKDALNADDWTPETWADVVDAYTAATQLPKDLTVDDQATIDAAAEALNDAIDALATAEVPLLLKAKEGSSTIIDRERGFIYGLDCAGVNAYSEYEFVTDLLAQNFVEIEGDGSLRYTYVGDNTVLGTGAKVEFINNKTGEVVETFYIVIFGDNNGDGTVTLLDTVDAVDYMAWNDCVHDYEDFTDPAVFAMDVDNNGSVTLNDFVVCKDYLAWNCDFIPQVR
ncbi:MAG: FIVAR domain-containing protein [Clostridia bacterium]|nr:FIVAR domain-containing protein [Clostridia bacterium]